MNNALNESLLSSSVTFPFQYRFLSLFNIAFFLFSISLSFPFQYRFLSLFLLNISLYFQFHILPLITHLFVGFHSLPSLSLSSHFLPSLYFFLLSLFLLSPLSFFSLSFFLFSPLGIPGSFQPCSLIFFHTSKKTWEETVLNPKKRIPLKRRICSSS